MKGQNDIFARYGQRPYTISFVSWDTWEHKNKKHQCVAGVHWYGGILCGHITHNKTIIGYWCWDKTKYPKPVAYANGREKPVYCPSLLGALMRIVEKYEEDQKLTGKEETIFPEKKDLPAVRHMPPTESQINRANSVCGMTGAPLPKEFTRNAYEEYLRKWSGDFWKYNPTIGPRRPYDEEIDRPVYQGFDDLYGEDWGCRD